MLKEKGIKRDSVLPILQIFIAYVVVRRDILRNISIGFGISMALDNLVSSRIKISKSMMKIGNVTALPSVYRDNQTNIPSSMVTTARRSLVLICISKHQSITKLVITESTVGTE